MIRLGEGREREREGGRKEGRKKGRKKEREGERDTTGEARTDPAARENLSQNLLSFQIRVKALVIRLRQR